MFNFGYCWMEGVNRANCEWWDLPLALLLSLIGVYVIIRYNKYKHNKVLCK